MRRDTWFKCDPRLFLDEILCLDDQRQAAMLVVVTMHCYEIGGPVPENEQLYAAAHLSPLLGRRAVDGLIALHKLTRLDGHLFSALYQSELRRIGRLPLPAQLRAAVLAKFGRCCVYCGSAEDLEIDHVVPVSRGGADDIHNLVPACGPCNRSKGAKLVEEWRGGVV